MFASELQEKFFNVKRSSKKEFFERFSFLKTNVLKILK